jgi:hypothetical protein
VDTVHVGILIAPAGPVTEQVSGTLPVNPPLGVTLTGSWRDPPRQVIVNEFPASVNKGPTLDPMTYAELDTTLVPIMGLIAIALMVSEFETGIGLVYSAEVAVGVEPFVV